MLAGAILGHLYGCYCTCYRDTPKAAHSASLLLLLAGPRSLISVVSSPDGGGGTLCT